RPSGADDDPPPGAVRRPARGLPHLPGLPPRPGSRSVLDALMPLLRSWDVGTAREPARRAGLVIGLAQLPLRPLVRLLSRPQWQGTENFPASGAVIACGNHLSAFDPFGYGHLLQASGIAPRFLAKESLFRVPVLG